MTSDYSNHVNQYVAECHRAGQIIPVAPNDYFTLFHDLVSTETERTSVFFYEDEYGYTRFYTVDTAPMSDDLSSYESLGFHSDQWGYPLCRDHDPFNWGDTYCQGKQLFSTHCANFSSQITM